MQVLHPRCAGLDVHKKTVVACVRLVEGGKVHYEVQTFSTVTVDLLRLADWLHQHGVTHVVLESTGVYWKPVWYALDDGELHLTLGNAAHIRNVPGRKTDVNDAHWLADLHAHGLVRASFVPSSHEAALRDLTRTRKQMVRERASHVQRIQKVLEDACLKLGDVLTDVMGKSGRAILQGLSEGITDVDQLLGRIDRRVASKTEALRRALQGRLRPHHQLLLKLHLEQIAALEQAIATIDREVGERLEPFRNQIERLSAIPGVSQTVAEVLAAEIGLDMSRFATDAHLRSWAGLCPRSDESAGKTRSRRTKPGDPWLKTMLVQAATSAARTKASYLGAQYPRLKGRRGHKRAVVAVAASILTIAYHLLRDGTTYQDLGVDYFQRREPEREAQRAVRKLKQLGYEVDLKKAA